VAGSDWEEVENCVPTAVVDEEDDDVTETGTAEGAGKGNNKWSMEVEVEVELVVGATGTIRRLLCLVRSLFSRSALLGI